MPRSFTWNVKGRNLLENFKVTESKLGRDKAGFGVKFGWIDLNKLVRNYLTKEVDNGNKWFNLSRFNLFLPCVGLEVSINRSVILKPQ